MMHTYSLLYHINFHFNNVRGNRLMFNNVAINKSLEKNITAQLTRAPQEKSDQHSAILSYMSKPNECLRRHQRQNTSLQT